MPDGITDFRLLRLRSARVIDRRAGKGFPPNLPHLPTSSRQDERIGPAFRRLARVFERGEDPLVLQEDPSGLAPERVVVFEVAGSVDKMANAIRSVPGLEYLGEHSSEFPPDADFFMVDQRRGKRGQRRDDQLITSTVYLAMPDLQALEELLGLWRRFKASKQFDRGFAPWRDVFKQLKELRVWGPKDRVTEEAILDFQLLLTAGPTSHLPVEIELWAHARASARKRARERIVAIVVESDGSVLHQSSIPEIAYEAMLANVPRQTIKRLVRRQEVQFAKCNDIMYVRPQALASPLRMADQLLPHSEERPRERLAMELAPIAALVDGLPVQDHYLLDKRIVVDDPDGTEDKATVSGRSHGTAMASVILHGDLTSHQRTLSRPLHVHPVLVALSGLAEEQFHPQRLVVDTFYRAVKRMKDGTGTSKPSAADVFLINVSLGDSRRPYANTISPWARLLDYLAFRYQILFVVSAGNISEPLSVSNHSHETFERASEPQRQESVLHSVKEASHNRTLLSPAEAINVVTVGACHDQFSVPKYQGSMVVDPYVDRSLPNVSSAIGLGHLRTMKPDILMPGGREMVSPHPQNGSLAIRPIPPRGAVGILAAAPSRLGRLDQTRFTSGTSVATALATRLAHSVFDALMDTQGYRVLSDVDPQYFAVIVRSLLVHSCLWKKESAEQVAEIWGPDQSGRHESRSDNVARVLGFGVPRANRIVTCSANRATMIGYGKIDSGQTLQHDIPLPPSLSGLRVTRAMTVTLAWLSPVNPRNRRYRMVTLELGKAERERLGTKDRASHQSGYYGTRRGTIVHERYDGSAVAEIRTGDYLPLLITCKTPTGPVDDPVPYGLAVTIEADGLIPVYDDVRTALTVPVRP